MRSGEECVRPFPILCLFNTTQPHIYIFTGCCLLEPGSREDSGGSVVPPIPEQVCVLSLLLCFYFLLQTCRFKKVTLSLAVFGPAVPNDRRSLSRGFKGCQRKKYFIIHLCQCSDVPPLFCTTLQSSRHRLALFFTLFTSCRGISPPSASPRQ